VRTKTETTDMISFAITILSLVVIGTIVTLLIRVQRGLLGFILATLALALLIYWLKEFRKTVKKELLPVISHSESEWVYDVVDHGSEMKMIAKVPGPESEVKASLVDHNLEILGGQGFRKIVKLLEEVEITDTTYRNGVLQVKLKKKTGLRNSTHSMEGDLS